MFYISGLPRSGSTLLCNILNQNSNCFASATSGLPNIVLPVKNGWDRVDAHQAMQSELSLVKKVDTLTAIHQGYYKHVEEDYIFDKSRLWLSNVEYLNLIEGGKLKIVATVRDVVDILASLEIKFRETSSVGMITQAATHPQHFTSLEKRCAFWMDQTQLLGHSLFALQDSIRRGYQPFIHIVEYDELTTNPKETMQKLYDFLEISPHDHDFENVEQTTYEDDRVHGILGLHTIRPTVRPNTRKWEAILGTAGKQYLNQEFWRLT